EGGGGPGRDVEAVEIEPVLAGDLEDVAEPARGDEGRPRVAPLHDGVGHDGGAVGDRRRPGRERGQPVEHAARRGVGGGRDLLRANRARLGIDGHEVGEGPPDIDPDPEAHGGLTAPRAVSYFRSDHLGMGKMTSRVAPSNGHTVQYFPPWSCTMMARTPTFWPVSSNFTPVQGMRRSAGLMSVLVRACRIASGSVEPARLMASTIVTMPVTARAGRS